MGTAGTTQRAASEVSDRSAGFRKARLSQFPRAAVTKSQSIPNNLRPAWKNLLGGAFGPRCGGAFFLGFAGARNPGSPDAAQRFCRVIKLLSRYGAGRDAACGRRFDRAERTTLELQRTTRRESALFDEARFIQSTVQQVSRGARRLDITAVGWHERHSFGVQSSDS